MARELERTDVNPKKLKERELLKNYAYQEALPPRMSAEELLPKSAVPQSSEGLETRAAQTNIKVRFIQPMDSGVQGGMYEMTLSDGRKELLTPKEYEVIGKRGQFKGYTEGEDLGGKLGQFIKYFQGGREAVQELIELGKAQLKAEEQNAQTEEARNQFREQLEGMAQIDIDALMAAIPDVTDMGGISDAFIANGIPIATMLALIATAGAGLATAPAGGIGAVPTAALLIPPAIAYDTYGGYKKLEATSAISTGNEAYGKFMAGRRAIGDLEIDLQAGRGITAKLSDGTTSSDPAEIYTDIVQQAVIADVTLKQMYDNDFFNIESNVGAQWQKVRIWLQTEPNSRRRFAEAYLNPPKEGTPEYEAAQQAWREKEARNAQDTSESPQF